MASKLGPGHPSTLATQNNLAAAYWEVGKLDRSVPLFEALLKQRESKLGPDHPDTLRSLANLGINFRDAGRLDDGIRLLEQALSRATADTGRFHRLWPGLRGSSPSASTAPNGSTSPSPFTATPWSGLASSSGRPTPVPPRPWPSSARP